MLVRLLWQSEAIVPALLPWRHHREVPSEAVEMNARGLRIPLLLLLVTVVAMANVTYIQRWGGFKEKATSTKNMNSTLHFFIQFYNNASNDTYLFRVQKLIQSQMQVCALVFWTSTQPPSCFFRHMGILTGLLGHWSTHNSLGSVICSGCT